MEAGDQNHRHVKEDMMSKDTGGGVTDSEDDDKGKRAARGGSSAKKVSGIGSSSMKSCQADRCSADLSGARTYHRRHKVCELHAKAPVVLVAGVRQRFCQQCSRFHEISEFDDSKRSCRRRLAGHNERRRKNFGEGNNSQAAEGSAGGRNLPFAVHENANYHHFNVTR